MKKLLLLTFAAALSFTSVSTPLRAASVSPAVITPADSTATRIALTSRLDEIKGLDKSDMSFKEKQDLRKESNEIKTELNNNYGGVYISLGALIIIILLLIIIF